MRDGCKFVKFFSVYRISHEYSAHSIGLGVIELVWTKNNNSGSRIWDVVEHVLHSAGGLLTILTYSPMNLMFISRIPSLLRWCRLVLVGYCTGLSIGWVHEWHSDELHAQIVSTISLRVHGSSRGNSLTAVVSFHPRYSHVEVSVVLSWVQLLWKKSTNKSLKAQKIPLKMVGVKHIKNNSVAPRITE